jgi:hypothetical protein
MTPAEMAYVCAKVINEGAKSVNLVKPKRMPKGFPRGEFMCETHKGKVYQYDAVKVLTWMIMNGLAKVEEEAGKSA